MVTHRSVDRNYVPLFFSILHYRMVRAPFTDGWNSIWHVIFGGLAVYFPIIALVFLFYQMVLQGKQNDLIDIFEFLVGYFIIYSTEVTDIFKKIEGPLQLPDIYPPP